MICNQIQIAQITKGPVKKYWMLSNQCFFSAARFSNTAAEILCGFFRFRGFCFGKQWYDNSTDFGFTMSFFGRLFLAFCVPRNLYNLRDSEAFRIGIFQTPFRQPFFAGKVSSLRKVKSVFSSTL